MMRRFWDVCAIVVAVGLAVAWMNGIVSAQGPDPALGTWRLNVAKSKYSPGPAPKSGTATFSAAGQGIKVVVEGAAATGDKTRFEYTANFDGKDYPMTGNPEADMVSIKRVNPTTVESMFKKGAKTMLTNTRVVSADGKTMTVTSKGTDSKGQTVNNVQIFEKQ